MCFVVWIGKHFYLKARVENTLTVWFRSRCAEIRYENSATAGVAVTRRTAKFVVGIICTRAGSVASHARAKHGGEILLNSETRGQRNRRMAACDLRKRRAASCSTKAKIQRAGTAADGNQREVAFLSRRPTFPCQSHSHKPNFLFTL